MNEMIKKDESLVDLDNTLALCEKLMKAPFYQKIGPEGIMAIVETAKSLEIDPRQALMGGLYYVRGKVEMSSRMMAALIRSNKHSITKDGKSNDSLCILNGKRSDTGDTWKASFSMEEAKRAGLLKNSVWQIYPGDMLYARALSRLARQLFPDIIGNCYVEGEITMVDDSQHKDKTFKITDELKTSPNTISTEQYENLSPMLDMLPKYKETIENLLISNNINSIKDMPVPMYEKVFNKAKKGVQLLEEKEVIHEPRD